MGNRTPRLNLNYFSSRILGGFCGGLHYRTEEPNMKEFNLHKGEMSVKVWFQVSGLGLEGPRASWMQSCGSTSWFQPGKAFPHCILLEGRLYTIEKFGFYVPLVFDLGTWTQFNSEIEMSHIHANILWLFSSHSLWCFIGLQIHFNLNFDRILVHDYCSSINKHTWPQS